ncbi:dTDP-4-amino-4,6-dideoxy-D-glucose transaminase [compost metagenome]
MLNYGDLSVLSFHATKVFNTFEGGAIVSHDAKTKQRIDYLKNFGFAGETRVVAPGINAKMNEVEAAFGLLQLNYIDQALAERKVIADNYRQLLEGVSGITQIAVPADVTWNYAYFPILVEPEFGINRDALYEGMKAEGIMTRRYFYPLITSFAMYSALPTSSQTNLPVANEIAAKVLCLPIYPGLAWEDQQHVVEVIRRAALAASNDTVEISEAAI